jgi:acyl-CoA synthetase (AMP-forming)/AMP-acid ligase II
VRRNFGDVIELGDDPEALSLIEVGAPHAVPRRFSFRDVDAGASGVARALSGRGFSRGDAIGILARNSFEYLICCLGTLRAGLVSVPINTRVPSESVEYICRDARVRAIFADRDSSPSCSSGVPLFQIDPPALKGFVDPGPFESVAPRAGETALIVYTSGSTGTPKGVVLSHCAQWVGFDAVDPAVRQMFRAQRAIVAAPLFHINGLGFCASILQLRGTIVLLPRFETRAFVEAIGAFGVGILTGLPTMVARIAREQELVARNDLSSVKLVFVGSAPLTETVVAQAKRLFPAAKLMNGYGTTETGGGTFGAHPEGLPRPQFSVGHPVAHAEVRLVGGPSPDQGVLEIRSPANMTGYRNLPELTEARVRDGWYHTGDVMRRDAEGFYYFVGREDDMFVCAGENVHPGEVERMLEGHPELSQVCVVPVEDPVSGQVPVAFAVARDGASPSQKEVKRFALERAPAHLHPRRVVFLDELPVGATGKVDRRALVQRLGATDRSTRPG